MSKERFSDRQADVRKSVLRLAEAIARASVVECARAAPLSRSP